MTKQPVFALVDCNNFFVSCERLFRPDLATKPCVVLSSNDGCAVARSNEVKALGVPMAAPAFKYRNLFEKHKVVQFSANFELYGDVSRRITALLTTITPHIEVYSVDESFLDLSDLDIEDYTAWGKAIREHVWKWIGIPVSIGIAPTKTLAKLASERAKKDESLGGVLDITNDLELRQKEMTLLPVQDVWGIGWRLAPKMKAEGIFNAHQLSGLLPKQAQQLMGIRGRQLVSELSGVSCYPLEREGKVRKSIARTRTFGHDTADAHIIEAAYANFASQAAYRLRVSGQLTRKLGVFATTDRHKPNYRSWSRETTFDMPSSDTGQLIKTAINLFSEFYSRNTLYHRAGVLLYDFVPDNAVQTDLLGFVSVAAHDKSVARMQAVDALNNRFGKRTVKFATENLGKAWEPKHNSRSPRYTTNWNDLPIIRT